MRELDSYLAELIKAQLENRIADELPSSISMNQIVEVAVQNQMKYLLLGALVRVSNLREEEREYLRKHVIQCVLRTAVQVKELEELERCFEEAGVVNQPMKGAVLRFLYPSPEMREMSDIDILIAEQNMEMASEILKQRGYLMAESIKHHDIYKKPPFLIVEAHRALYDKTVDRNQHGYFSNFSRTKVKEGCQHTQVFGVEDFYVYMMSHMAKHFYQTGCGIRHLVDIYVYLNTYRNSMDRKYVERELDRCGILTFTINMEQLAFGWLDGGKLSPLHEKLFDYMLDSGIYGKDENGIWNKFVYQKGSDKEMSRGQLKRWYFFPPLYYMSEYYPYLEKKPWLLPWAWLVRGVCGVFGHKGTFKRKMIDHIDQEQIQTLKTIYEEMELRFKP